MYTFWSGTSEGTMCKSWA